LCPTQLNSLRKQKAESTGDETTKLIGKARPATGKRYSAEEKTRMGVEGIRGEEPVGAICRREGIHTNMYYRWLKSFREAGYQASRL